MNISYNWLSEYVDHDLDPQALADALTMAGLEVEEVEAIGTALDGVVVGHVLETRAHPNADRLTLCQVDLGPEHNDDGEPVQIVCGAPNVAAGQKVPVATVGTTLMLPSRQDPSQKEAVTIKKAKLRGEPSRGMICAEDELGLSDDHAGIMVLDEEAPVGEPLADYLKARGVPTQDWVFDIAITPNRPDATSHLGVARDVAALQDVLLEQPDVELPQAGGETAEQVSVQIDDPDGCPRYVALLVRGVTAHESPAWLKARLAAVGLRPRNVLVDITNYVMYEYGQPLHAFDADQIAGHQIVVRAAEGGETFTTLDSKAHTLPSGTLLICDAERPVALAGLMGGENSEVTEATTNVLLESAYFDPSTIRKAAKALGISTDASYRFERGVDRTGQVWAAARAAQLMAELAGGTVVAGMVDAHPAEPEPAVVPLRPSRVAHVLGVDVPADEAQRILEALGFEVEDEEPLEAAVEQLLEGRPPEAAPDTRLFRCTVPPWRPDVTREVDLIEEVARIYGYDRIPEPPHTALPNRPPRELPAAQLRRSTRALLAGLGYRETYSNSMLPKEDAERFNVPLLAGVQAETDAAGRIVETLNPITQDMTALRPSLLPRLLEIVAHNQNHGQDLLRFFEFGHVFHRAADDDGAASEAVIPGYAEHETCLLVLSGPEAVAGWDRQPRTVDIFDLKGTTEHLLASLRIPDVEAEPVYKPTGVSAYGLALRAGDTPIGFLGRLSDALMDVYDLRRPVYFAELDWSTITALAAPYAERVYTSVERFPAVDRDLAVVVPQTQPAGPMLAAIHEAGRPLLRHADVFDLYEGEHIEKGHKSIAFTLRFGASRTLTDAEVDAQIDAILKRLEQDFGATLRG